MNFSQFLLVAAGGGLGASCRWMLSVLLNAQLAWLPLGTLVANWLGGFLMGILMGVLTQLDTLSDSQRLFLGTGFLGGLTTFSTFSAEISALLMRQQWALAGSTLLLHAGGSVLLTLLGYWLVARLAS